MNINTNTLLNTMLTKIDPSIKAKIEKLSIDGKVDLNSLVKDKGMQTLLSELFKDIANGIKNKSEVVTLLENNKHSLQFKNISDDIKQILSILKTNLPQLPILEKAIIVLEKSLIDIKTINQKILKTSIENSGVYLESKLSQINFQENNKELLKNNMSNTKYLNNDMKNILLQVKEQIEHLKYSEAVIKELKTSIDKVLSQIDYYQLSSFSSNSSHAFISFLQDDIRDVDIKFKNDENGEFSCLINLTLKENGDLKILLQLDEKNRISINIGVENQNFKVHIQNALQKLRTQINTLGLSLLNLNIFDLNDDKNKSNEFKAYIDNQGLDFGLDIKV